MGWNSHLKCFYRNDELLANRSYDYRLIDRSILTVTLYLNDYRHVSLSIVNCSRSCITWAILYMKLNSPKQRSNTTYHCFVFSRCFFFSKWCRLLHCFFSRWSSCLIFPHLLPDLLFWSMEVRSRTRSGKYSQTSKSAFYDFFPAL